MNDLFWILFSIEKVAVVLGVDEITVKIPKKSCKTFTNLIDSFK